MKRSIIILVAVLFLILIVSVFKDNLTGEAKRIPSPKAQCNDRVDNDGDGYCDFLSKNAGCSGGAIAGDGGCTSREDNDETDCGDGVCEGGETQQDCPADCGMPDSCSDSDGGYNIKVQGSVIGYSNGNAFGYIDTCLSSISLKEYYCNVNNPTETTYDCSQGGNVTISCLNGACV